MSGLTVEAIKDAITQLDEEDRVSLASWLSLETADEWDRQMHRDFSPGGAGLKFVEQLRQEVAEGMTQGDLRPLDELFRDRS